MTTRATVATAVTVAAWSDVTAEPGANYEAATDAAKSMPLDELSPSYLLAPLSEGAPVGGGMGHAVSLRLLYGHNPIEHGREEAGR
jgi:hypothetical protein